MSIIEKTIYTMKHDYFIVHILYIKKSRKSRKTMEYVYSCQKQQTGIIHGGTFCVGVYFAHFRSVVSDLYYLCNRWLYMLIEQVIIYRSNDIIYKTILILETNWLVKFCVWLDCVAIRCWWERVRFLYTFHFCYSFSELLINLHD